MLRTRTALLTLFAISPLAALSQDRPGPSLGFPLPKSDPRQVWVGRWTAVFRLDSTRGRDGSLARWQPASAAERTGTLTIGNTIVGRGRRQLLADLAIDFRPLLGREMSCFPMFPSSIDLEQVADSVEIAFTPNAADCGFTGTVKLDADSAVGSWWEHSFAGPVAMGRLRLRKAP